MCWSTIYVLVRLPVNSRPLVVKCLGESVVTWFSTVQGISAPTPHVIHVSSVIPLCLFQSLDYLPLSVFCQRTMSKGYLSLFYFLCMLLIWSEVWFICFCVDAIGVTILSFLILFFNMWNTNMVQKSNDIKS